MTKCLLSPLLLASNAMKSSLFVLASALIMLTIPTAASADVVAGTCDAMSLLLASVVEVLTLSDHVRRSSRRAPARPRTAERTVADGDAQRQRRHEASERGAAELLPWLATLGVLPLELQPVVALLAAVPMGLHARRSRLAALPLLVSEQELLVARVCVSCCERSSERREPWTKRLSEEEEEEAWRFIDLSSSSVRRAPSRCLRS